MTNYKNLHKAIEAETKRQKSEKAYYIRNGYCKNWSEENKKRNDEGIKRNLTDLQYSKYQDGAITRKQAIEKAIARANKEIDKRAEKHAKHLATVEQYDKTKIIEIFVTWKRSSVWGYCPSVTLYTNRGTYYGSASGCGYDKESAAVADALNQANEVLTALFKLANGRKAIPYGTTAKWSTLPHFEGGVGMNSIINVLEACGYKKISEAHNSKADCYILSIK